MGVVPMQKCRKESDADTPATPARFEKRLSNCRRASWRLLSHRPVRRKAGRRVLSGQLPEPVHQPDHAQGVESAGAEQGVARVVTTRLVRRPTRGGPSRNDMGFECGGKPLVATAEARGDEIASSPRLRRDSSQ